MTDREVWFGMVCGCIGACVTHWLHGFWTHGWFNVALGTYAFLRYKAIPK